MEGADGLPDRASGDGTAGRDALHLKRKPQKKTPRASPRRVHAGSAGREMALPAVFGGQQGRRVHDTALFNFGQYIKFMLLTD
jgi:hypothetical protein